MGSKLQNDLRVVFGFSAENARKAEALWRAGKLPEKYKFKLDTLFYAPYNNINPTFPRLKPDLIFNELNYKISIGEL